MNNGRECDGDSRPFHVPWRRSGATAAPTHSIRLHREALVEAIDPEIARSTSQSLQPRREGGIEFPQTRYLRWNLREIDVSLHVALPRRYRGQVH